MKLPATCLAFAVLAAGCADDKGISDSSGDVATGNDSSRGTVSGTVRTREDGMRLFVLNRGNATCTAVFDPPDTGNASLKEMDCTDGNNGNATLVYESGGAAARVVYSAGIDGGGTIIF